MLSGMGICNFIAKTCASRRPCTSPPPLRVAAVTYPGIFGKCSRNTSLISVCHPGPVARNRSTTSESSRKLTRCLGAAIRGRPRSRRRISAASPADAARIRASRTSSSGKASASPSAAAAIARSSSSVISSSNSRARAPASSRAALRPGIPSNLPFRRPTKTNHPYLFIPAPHKNQKAQF